MKESMSLRLVQNCREQRESRVLGLALGHLRNTKCQGSRLSLVPYEQVKVQWSFLECMNMQCIKPVVFTCPTVD